MFRYLEDFHTEILGYLEKALAFYSKGKSNLLSHISATLQILLSC